MTYDAFTRGPHPVGVKSEKITYQNGERTIPVEIWYPALDSYAGQDIDSNTQDKYSMAQGFPETPQTAVRNADAKQDTFPLIVFSHGFAGHRRQTTHLMSHLASHGYVVISPDHIGNTLLDIMGLAGKMQGKGFSNVMDLFQSFMQNRPQDARVCIDEMLSKTFDLNIDKEAIGICGHSFGGWTSLATSMNDERIKAVIPLAPAGGKSKTAISNGVDFAMNNIKFANTIPCLYLVADQDTLLPLDSMEDLYSNTPEPKRMLILENSDHFHFCDNVEFIHDAMINMGSGLFGQNNEEGVLSKMQKSSELCSGKDAYTFLQSACLAHFDAYVKNNSHAKSFLDNEFIQTLKEKHISLSEYA